MKNSLLHLFLLISVSVSAQTPQLFKQINSAGDADPYPFHQVGEKFYFFASDNDHGRELWVSDGTAEGTHMVKDINPTGDQGKFYSGQMVSLNNVVYFFATDGVHGYELWKSDGTVDGTVMVKEINPIDNAIYSSAGLIVYKNHIYFNAYNVTTGQEVWKSDGTADGTAILKELKVDGDNDGVNSPAEFTIFNNELYFIGKTTNAGPELWKTDGTADGTVLIKDINSGTNGSYPAQLLVHEGLLYFFAEDGVHGREPWVTNGTTDGTTLLKDIQVGSGSSIVSSYFIANDTYVFFKASDGTGEEIYKTDGTTNNTVLIKDINPSGSAEVFTKDSYGIFNNKLYFSAYESASTGSELWVSDGTSEGTTILKDINTGYQSSSPMYFHVFGGSLYFSAIDGVNGRELWSTDGTAEGTELVADLNNGGDFDPANFFTFTNGLYFQADGGDGYQLWYINVPASVQSPIVNNILKAFPNPTNGTINIDLSNLVKPSRICVFNSLGQQIKEEVLSATAQRAELILDGLTTGVYRIQVEDENGNNAVTIFKH